MTQEEKMLFGIEIISGMKASLYGFDMEQGRAEAMSETFITEEEKQSGDDIHRLMAVFQAQRLVEQAFFIADVALNYLSAQKQLKTNPLERFYIGSTEIILEDVKDGAGSIIVADTDRGYNFSFFWWAMGTGHNIKSFIAKTNPDYFAGKLVESADRNVFDSKATFKEVRKAIREELPWYKYRGFQKELRIILNDYERDLDGDTQENFVRRIQGIHDDVIFDDPDLTYKKAEDLLDSIFYEPWNLIKLKPSPKNLFLQELHSKLKKRFKDENN